MNWIRKIFKKKTVQYKSVPIKKMYLLDSILTNELQDDWHPYMFLDKVHYDYECIIIFHKITHD